MATKSDTKSENNNSNNNWDELTDSFITGIDDSILKNSEIKLRDVLSNPSKYAQKSDATTTLKKMQSAVDAYFSEVKNTFASEIDKLNLELESISVIYSKITSIINEKTELLKIPLITPYTIDIKESNSENIIIDSYNTSLETLIAKLISSSNYVAEISTKYKDHTLGSWIFSADKIHIITIKPPENIIIDVENSQSTLNDYLSSFSDEINLYKSSKETKVN
jgi:hypothetical protein